MIPMAADSLLASARCVRRGSCCLAPGVGNRRVASLTTPAIQAGRDDDELIRLCLLLHLQQALDDSLRLAGHHASVFVPAGLKVGGGGQLLDLLRRQRLADTAPDVLD